VEALEVPEIPQLTQLNRVVQVEVVVVGNLQILMALEMQERLIKVMPEETEPTTVWVSMQLLVVVVELELVVVMVHPNSVATVAMAFPQT
jgi:hypothetical protein